MNVLAILKNINIQIDILLRDGKVFKKTTTTPLVLNYKIRSYVITGVCDIALQDPTTTYLIGRPFVIANMTASTLNFTGYAVRKDSTTTVTTIAATTPNNRMTIMTDGTAWFQI